MRDLREEYAKIEIQSSEPIVPFRETLSCFGCLKPAENTPLDGIVSCSTSGNQCTIRIQAIPLAESVTKLLQELEAEIMNIENDANYARTMDKRCQIIAKLDLAIQEAVKSNAQFASIKIDWKVLLENIVQFGPKRCGQNILVDFSSAKLRLYIRAD